ncbi:MAG: hypothetical protein MJ146_01605 [Clostridia bacterium]|nr:hypothetical protein [Clostridia bacterium]
MKSNIKKRTYKAIYRLLDRVNPVPYDCGTLCNCLCCIDEGFDEEMGIYLLPGEEKIHNKKDPWLSWTQELAEDYDFPDSWFGKIYFVKCTNPPNCPREKRPIQCRTFPLAPHIKDGELILIETIDELPYECPLIHEELDPKFIKATYTVWKHLIRDERIYDLVKMDSDEREEYIHIYP